MYGRIRVSNLMQFNTEVQSEKEPIFRVRTHCGQTRRYAVLCGKQEKFSYQTKLGCLFPIGIQCQHTTHM